MAYQSAKDTRAVVLQLLDELFGSLKSDFSIRLWDGCTWGVPPGNGPAFTLVLQHPGALRQMLLPASEENLARCYIRGDFDIEGNFEAVVPLSRSLLGQQRSVLERAGLALRLLRLPGDRPAQQDGRRAQLVGASHSLSRDREAVTHHYDVSNDFYKLWLDRRMVYSCAYFAEGDDLDRAQERKLDLLCRKLRLQPGQRLLDIGCGWGGLLLHAVKNYGVEGVGVTLSQPQADEANQRFAAAGISRRCQALVCDYRALDKNQAFDAIVSVGMVEHVGNDHLEEYFGAAWQLLRPGGAFLLHGIGDLPGRPMRTHRGFVRTYVFPDSDLPPIARVLTEAEQHQFEVRDVESLRENYTKTLRHWAQRLEANRQVAIDEVGEQTYRIWRLYLSGCAWWFERGFVSVYQSLFVKRTADGASGLPLNRFDWYDGAAADSSTGVGGLRLQRQVDRRRREALAVLARL